MSLTKVLFTAATALTISSGVAFADEPAADGDGSAAAPVNSPNAAETETATPVAETGSVGRPLTLRKGEVAIHLDLGINLGKDSVGKPVSLAPDIWYGVSDKFSIGLVHGTGLCFTGEENGCPKVYNDVGLEGLFSLKRDEKSELAARIGVGAIALDPDFVGRVTVGLSYQYIAGKLGIYLHPGVSIGLNKRDEGNKEAIEVPVKIAYQAAPKLSVFLHTGLSGVSPIPGQAGVNPQLGAAGLDGDEPFGFSDTYAIPLGVGALYSVSEKLDVGAEFLFPYLAGADAATADFRALILSANIRL